MKQPQNIRYLVGAFAISLVRLGALLSNQSRDRSSRARLRG